MSQDADERQRRRDMVAAVNAGANEEEIADRFYVARSTARMYIYKIKKGIISAAPSGPRQPRIGRRGRALAMYAAGRTLDEVVAATGLKRGTASTYRWEYTKMEQHKSYLAWKAGEPNPFYDHINNGPYIDPLCD